MVNWKKRAMAKKTKSGEAVMSYSWRSLTEKGRTVSRVTEASLSHQSDLLSPLSSSSHSYALFKYSILHRNTWLLRNSKTEKMGQNNGQLSQSEHVWTDEEVQGQDFNYRQHFLLQPLITQGISLKVFIGALGLQSISSLFGPMLGSCHPDDDRDDRV